MDASFKHPSAFTIRVVKAFTFPILLSFFLLTNSTSYAQGDPGRDGGLKCPEKVTGFVLAGEGDPYLICPNDTVTLVVLHNGTPDGSGANDAAWRIFKGCGDHFIQESAFDTINVFIGDYSASGHTFGVVADDLEGACSVSDCMEKTVFTNDQMDPVPTLEPLPIVTGTGSITVPSGNNTPTATDNCEAIIHATSDDTGATFTTTGIHSVTWIYTDNSGNTVTQHQDFEVLAGTHSNLHMVNDTICEGESIMFGGQNITQAGVYIDTISVIGGDSIVELSLYVNPILDLSSVSIVELGAGVAMLGADSTFTGVTYQWLNCANGFEVEQGQTGAVYNDPAVGEYSLEITDDCGSDTTNCHNYTGLAVSELERGSFQIIPNPVLNQFELKIKNTKSGNKIDVLIYDGLGKMVFQKQLVMDGLKNVMDVNNLESGVYYLELIDEITGAKVSQQLVKE